MTETQSFFTDGEAYERMMGRWSRAAGEDFLDWLDLPQGLRWLDIGCGTGAFTQLLLDRCAPARSRRRSRPRTRSPSPVRRPQRRR